MKVKAFIWGVMVNLILSFFLSLIVGIATNIYNELPVNLDTVCMPLLYGTIIGTLTTTIIPVNKIGIKFATWQGAPQGNPLCGIYKNFVILAFMVPIMNFFVTGLMIGFGTQEFINAWLYPIIFVYPVGYVVSMLGEPIAMAIASFVTRFDPTKVQREESVGV